MCDRLACVKATEMFKQTFNCAESVLAGVADELGIESELIPRIASGFGAGISRRGETCGALSGAIMALGIKYGRTTPDNSAKAVLYAMVGELWTAFEQKFEHVTCNELTGCEMLSEEGMNEFKSRNLHNTLCPKFVAWAAEHAMTLIDAKSGR